MRIIEDMDGAPLPWALQPDGELWQLACMIIRNSALDYGPPLSVEALIERTDEAMRRIAPLTLPDWSPLS